ncbi:hypothetical protein TSAR_000608 [Trichomalopsis sarcophagae]|uniref:Uncharacterized protein n=1 Tax=Trichomalopsis sarcophagae TaxID=543379 RepID=A0A232FAX8_9HYME|nr:hypothetical protein TSAR_000608 [Trichomalopsis sarcophagae]
MFQATPSHLVKVLRSVLRYAKAREPHTRTMCGSVWSSALDRLPLHTLCKKLHFYYYIVDVLTIVVQTIRQRNDRQDDLAAELIRRH